MITKQTPMYIQIMFNYDYSKEEAETLWAQALPFDIGTIRYNAAQNIIGFVKAMME